MHKTLQDYLDEDNAHMALIVAVSEEVNGPVIERIWDKIEEQVFDTEREKYLQGCYPEPTD